ncbi:MAG: FxLYD domain-containing protein [Aphanocapsa sp. GSE-SYN-MK-11-07L]|jgi:hypothetical protein|nr:FxLYD domain-containing protein [Aphanocapsa sp. GSE-SYN-MK-11-07L]
MATLVLHPITKLALGSLCVSLVALNSLPGQAQSAGDVVVIGNSPGQWSQNQFYWNQLLGLSGAAQVKQPANPLGDQAAANPQTIEKQLLSGIRISGIQLQPIIKLPGSSQLIGTLTNGNSQPVTISGVNFKVVDDKGNFIQSGTAVPQPATVGPGQTVTFQTMLSTVPADSGARVILMNPPVAIQGGV